MRSSLKPLKKGENGLKGSPTHRAELQFIEKHISVGHSVLIHCLAGAHRAGTCGVAYLMWKTGMGVDDAIAVAKNCRPVISPFATLLALLRNLEKDLVATNAKFKKVSSDGDSSRL